MKKTQKLLVIIVAAIAIFSLGVGAATTSTVIKAALNKSIAITVDDEDFKPTDTKGSRLYPIVYNGVTYVPLTAFAKSLGADAQYVSKGNGTYTVSSGIDATPTEDTNSSIEDTPSTSDDNSDSKIVNITYDKNKQSTWVKFSNIKFESKTSSDGLKYYLVTMDVTNRASSTIDFTTYGDIRIRDTNDKELTSIIGVSPKSSATLKPGETATVSKGFSASSLNAVSYLQYYPLKAPKGDITKVYINN